MTDLSNLLPLLQRIAEALERQAPPFPPALDLMAADAFVWHADRGWLEPVPAVARVEIDLLQGIDRAKEVLLANTERFIQGLPANNALLWGVRGMGKSSLVKAVHAAVNAKAPAPPAQRLALIEIHREDIPSLPQLLSILRGQNRRCLLFCDDLSFEAGDTSYKSLKAILDGGIEGRPETTLLYATSNRRHILSRDMIENERSTAIHAGETVEEKISLSDRFGLWLGFHACDQETYLAMIDGYQRRFGLGYPAETLRTEALEWAITRGARSGRTAWHFIQDLAGRLGQDLK